MAPSPRRNRVTPLGEIVAHPGRGLVYANRGCLHDEQGRLRRSWNGRRWIACRLRFRDWQRPGLMMPGRFTELFFLDEACALAAGHRPCALCRREDYRSFRVAWAQLGFTPTSASVDEVDRRLHDERVTADGGRPMGDAVDVAELPAGAFVHGGDRDGSAWLVLDDALVRYDPGGYTDRRPRRGRLVPITPPSLIAILAAGWRGEALPLIHPSAGAAEEQRRAVSGDDGRAGRP